MKDTSMLMGGVPVCTADNSSTQSFSTSPDKSPCEVDWQFLQAKCASHDVFPVGAIGLPHVYNVITRLCSVIDS
eukprot:4672309-Karenia_brevis.AAC.1